MIVLLFAGSALHTSAIQWSDISESAFQKPLIICADPILEMIVSRVVTLHQQRIALYTSAL
jgi:hypothetical protein